MSAVRIKKSPEQLGILEEEFKKDSSLSGAKQERIAAKAKLTVQAVQFWFRFKLRQAKEHSTKGKYIKRTKYTEEQTQYLLEEYNKDTKCGAQRARKIAKEIGVEKHKVISWFQNRLSKSNYVKKPAKYNKNKLYLKKKQTTARHTGNSISEKHIFRKRRKEKIRTSNWVKSTSSGRMVHEPP